jgi:hypothetical protein
LDLGVRQRAAAPGIASPLVLAFGFNSDNDIDGNRQATVKILLENGANPNAPHKMPRYSVWQFEERRSRTFTALHLAIFRRDKQIVELMLDKPKLRTGHACRPSRKRQALLNSYVFDAIRYTGGTTIADMILDKYISAMILSPYLGHSLSYYLRIAVWASNLSALALLLSHGADPDFYTPVDRALHPSTHEDILSLLLKHGAKAGPEPPARNPLTALIQANLGSLRQDETHIRVGGAYPTDRFLAKFELLAEYGGHNVVQSISRRLRVALFSLYCVPLGRLRQKDIRDRIVKFSHLSGLDTMQLRKLASRRTFLTM